MLILVQLVVISGAVIVGVAVAADDDICRMQIILEPIVFVYTRAHVYVNICPTASSTKFQANIEANLNGSNFVVLCGIELVEWT